MRTHSEDHVGKSLLDKVWEAHTVRELPSGQTQLFIGLHLVHEVTSPQAFQMMREQDLTVPFPERTFATVDHIIPTDTRQRPYADTQAEGMMSAIEHNCREFGIRFFDASSGHQGIVHVLGPELGLTQPGHDRRLRRQSHQHARCARGGRLRHRHQPGARRAGDAVPGDPASRRCGASTSTARCAPGVYAKDVILHIIRRLGVKGGVGYAYEYAGAVLERMTMEERMTVCNMSIEGGARLGYVNPDETTFEYLRGREFAPSARALRRAPWPGGDRWPRMPMRRTTTWCASTAPRSRRR